jgi:hypothetical protein
MKITDQLLWRHFTLPNPNISHHDVGFVPFNFVDRGQDTLLVTFGDSWTYGDDLTIDNDQAFRLENVYGNQLSKSIGADFLNLSVPGSGNQWTPVLFEEFTQLNLDYKQIIAVITFTEIGRDFNGWFDRDVDYSSWLKNNIHCSQDYTKFLQWQNTQIANKIVELADQLPNLKLLVSTNFVDPIGLEPFGSKQLDKTWLQVYRGSANDVCYFVSPYIIEKYKSVLDIEWSLDKATWLEWADECLSNANQRLTIIKDPQYFRGLYHPLVEGHRAWACYLEGQL